MKLLIFLLTFLFSSLALGQTVRTNDDQVVNKTLGKSIISVYETEIDGYVMVK